MNAVASFLLARMAEAQMALTLLTRLPAGKRTSPGPSLAAASWAFPLAGLAVGGIAAIVLYGALWFRLPPAIAAGLALAAGLLATGGLHEDGLADVADGFGGGANRDRKLEIMRDSRIGSYGTLALILIVGLRWSALATLASHDAGQAAAALLAIAIASRAGLPVMLAVLPPARQDGLGHAAARPSRLRTALAVAFGILALVFLLGGAAAISIALAQGIALLAMGRLALRQIGGQTGDVLGAMQQTGDLCAWIVLIWLAG